jgi:hypothetical protein
MKEKMRAYIEQLLDFYAEFFLHGVGKERF